MQQVPELRQRMEPHIHTLVSDAFEGLPELGVKVRLTGWVVTMLLQDSVDLFEFRNVRHEVELMEVIVEGVPGMIHGRKE